MLPVGDRRRHTDVDPLAGDPGTVVVIARFGLDADDLGVGGHPLGDRCDPGEQSATADRYQ